MNYVYEQLAPPAVLSRWIAAFWQLRDANGEAALGTQRVLPDGCVDILFDFGRWRAGGCNAGGVAPAGRLVGTMTRALVVPMAGQADLFGIRFRPGVIGQAIAPLSSAAWCGFARRSKCLGRAAAPGRRWRRVAVTPTNRTSAGISASLR